MGELRMQKKQLCDYLRIVMNLEIQLRTIKETYERKNSFINELKSGNIIEKPRKSEKTDPATLVMEFLLLFIGGWGLLFFIKIVCEKVLGKIVFKILNMFLIIPTEIFGIIVSIIGIWVILEAFWNAKKDKEDYQNSVKKYNEAVEENKKLIKKNEEKIKLISKECEQLKGQWNKAKGMLEEYYALGVVSREYRKLVPVATFLQYLESGRCDKLEGHEGAYNLYHQELMGARILEKLDEISKTTKETQWMLKNAISESNRKINYMCNKMDVIEQHEAVNAYYNEIAADNTTYLKNYVVYKDLLS